ncbi:MAG: response regulator, partial [Cytophagales bacterium]
FKYSSPFILLVDDNAVNRKVGGEMLRKAGCKVEFAENGFVAIEKVKELDFDLVLMDIQMPELDGVATTMEIRKIDKKLPPIIAMTAYSMKEDRDKFLSLGMDDYLSKPIRSEALLKKINEWIKDEGDKSSLFSNQQLLIEEEQNEINNEKQIINLEVVEQLKNLGGNELMFSILTEFITEAKPLVMDCKRYFDLGMTKELKSNLHTVKGTAATIGLDALSKTAEDMESLIKNNNFEQLNEWFPKLESVFDKTIVHIDILIKKA